MNTIFKSTLNKTEGLININFNKKNSKTYLAITLSIGIVSTSHANITVDTGASKNQQPGISTYKDYNMDNGYNLGSTAPEYPLINIQTPNADGLSHNKYTQFDVNEGKVAFNNRVAYVTEGNPNLQGQSAHVILNEINSSSSSKLNGQINIFGNSAHIIFANLSGIDCNGCEFINAHQVTLTSGTPVFKNGLLDKFIVNQGNIIISSAGIKNQQRLDLFAESVKIGGKVNAGHILVIAGKNDIGFAKPSHSFLDLPSKKIGVDVSEFGGMYANKITIISKNREVHNQGDIEAYNISINATNSMIYNKNGNIKGRYRTGMHSEETKEFRKNDGIKLISKNLFNQDGKIATTGRNININSSMYITNINGIIDTGNYIGKIKAKTKYINNTSGKISSGDSLTLDTDTLRNNKGFIFSANNNVSLSYKILTNKIGMISANKIITHSKNSGTHEIIYSNKNIEMGKYNKVYLYNGSSFVSHPYRPKESALIKTIEKN
jgi:filamentous hemagglutinin family protein